MKHLLLIFAALILFGCSKDTVKPTENESIHGVWGGNSADGAKISVIFNVSKGNITIQKSGTRGDVTDPSQEDFTYSFDGSTLDTKGSDLAGTYLDGKVDLSGKTLTITSRAGKVELKSLN